MLLVAACKRHHEATGVPIGVWTIPKDDCSAAIRGLRRYDGSMLMPRGAPRPLLTLLALTLAWDTVWANQGDAPVAALAPDQRPTLVVITEPGSIVLVHHAHPLPQSKAEQLALKLGLIIAIPIIRRRARESSVPLPAAWSTAAADHRFTQELTAALDRTQVNWPWRSLRIVATPAEASAIGGELKGQDVAIVRFSLQLEDLERAVQFSAEAHLLLVRNADTLRESRTQILIRHLAPQLPADAEHPERSAALFQAGGPFDQMVGVAAHDLTRALAVTIARLATPTPVGPIVSRHFVELAIHPKCPECRPDDTVLHEEPGRVWVAPSALPGTVLSLPR
jgi:hypothetical protein